MSEQRLTEGMTPTMGLESGNTVHSVAMFIQTVTGGGEFLLGFCRQTIGEANK